MGLPVRYHEHLLNTTGEAVLEMCEFELLNQHPVPTWIYSVGTNRFLAVNEAMIRCYGYSRQQLLTMTIDQIRPPEDLDRFHQHLSENNFRQHATSTWRHLRHDGTLIDVEVESTAVTFRGESARLVAARNVTGVWDTIEKFNLALGAGNFALWEYDLEVGSLHWDPVHSGIYGIDRNLFPTDIPQFLAMIVPEYRATIQTAFDRCVMDGAPYDCEFQINLPGIGTRWRHAVGKRIADRSGKPVKIIGIGADITDKKELEEQILRSQRLEAVGRLASGIAHDFNNILTVISGYSQLIKDEELPSYLVNAGVEIGVAADRAARLVRQLLEFSRTKLVDPKPIKINDLIDETMVLIRRLLPSSIQTNVTLSPESMVICADPGQVEQLIMNTCLNARDAMAEGGVLTVDLTAVSDSFARITISDTGSGISPDVQKRMFEPFFTTKQVGSGCGLGLSIVHGIVKQLGGTIDVHSVPGQGSVFMIELPLARNR